MRWNCPHCGIALAVSDDKLGAGWSFSKCYKCGKFALVRRSDVNLIKIDHVPAGEKMLVPEGATAATPLMSRQATEHLQRIAPGLGASMAGATAAPTTPAVAAPPPASPEAEAPSLPMAPVSNDKPVIRPAVRRRSGTQVQTPEKPKMGTGATAAGPVKISYAVKAVPKVQTRGISIAAPGADPWNQLPEPLPEEPQNAWVRRLIPAVIAVSALVAVASGTYLYVQALRVWKQARVDAQAAAQAHLEAQAAKAEPAVSQRAIQAPAQPVIAHQAAPADSAVTSDQVHQNAMAPQRRSPASVPKNPPAALVVRPKAGNVKLRSGPGVEYPVLGIANPDINYLVQEWKSDWFKVTLPSSDGTAWVRNDLVSLITLDRLDRR